MPQRKPPEKAPTVMGEPGARLRTSKDDLPSTPTIPGKATGRKRGPDAAPVDDATRVARERKGDVDRAERARAAGRRLKGG